MQHALSLGEHAQTVRCFYLSATAKHMRLGHGNVQIMYLRVYRDSQTDQASAVLSHALHTVSPLPHGPVTPREQPSTQARNQGGSMDAARMAF